MVALDDLAQKKKQIKIKHMNSDTSIKITVQGADAPVPVEIRGEGATRPRPSERNCMTSGGDYPEREVKVTESTRWEWESVEDPFSLSRTTRVGDERIAFDVFSPPRETGCYGDDATNALYKIFELEQYNSPEVRKRKTLVLSSSDDESVSEETQRKAGASDPEAGVEREGRKAYECKRRSRS